MFSKSDSVSILLNENNSAVERAMLRLALSGTDERQRAYYANWISQGKKLTRHHLTNAREIALRNIPALIAIAEADGKTIKPKALPINKDCTLTMTREGMFKLETFGNSHCGLGKNIDVKYKAVIKCSPSTDHRGFLFDQINVHNFFQNVKRSSLSCERLAIKCTNDLVAALIAENPTVVIRELELSLSPEPFAASMSYSWKA